jgi:hypothetical protein
MRQRHVFVGVVVVGMLTACSGGSGVGEEREEGQASSAVARSAEEDAPAPTTQLSVPELYDTSKGWETDLPGSHHRLPHSHAVAVFGTAGNTGQFTVLDVTSGETDWVSAELRGAGEDMQYEAISATVGGQDYLVAWASGTVGADVVSRGRAVTTIDIFPAHGSGGAVKPAHHIELNGDRQVFDGGGGLMVTQGDVIVSVDLASGATKEYNLDELEPPAGQCDSCTDTEVLAITARGPLLKQTFGILKEVFWVPDAWSSGDITNSDNPFASLIWDDVLVARWREEGDAQETWGVLDTATGEVHAEVRCDPPRGVNDDDADGATRSSNGRYLVRDNTVFDLEQGTGHCFEATEKDKPVHLNGVIDNGVAFGIAAGDENSLDGPTPVLIDIATGTVEESEHSVVPFADYGGFGLFWDDQTRTIVAYPHKS